MPTTRGPMWRVRSMSEYSKMVAHTLPLGHQLRSFVAICGEKKSGRKRTIMTSSSKVMIVLFRPQIHK